jgi:hypothetical protein
MITAKLKQILIDSGCTFVLYESDKLANLYADRSDQSDIVGIIIQQNTITLEVKANAILEHYPPVVIEILAQVRLEDKAEHNEVRLQELLNICKEVIVRLIASAQYKQIKPLTLTKIQETKYDANLIGWSMPLDLTYLLNETRDPCI